MSSAAEAELGAMYINARKAIEERIILEEMGHKQPATPVQVDNSTAEGIINKRVQPKRTKAMDVRFHWLWDRSINQKQFQFYNYFCNSSLLKTAKTQNSKLGI
jgi:hypothetical protein